MTKDRKTQPNDPASPPSAANPEAGLRPPYGWATLVGGLVFLLYWVTLAPTTAFWDTSEYIATAWIMGVPHPPGNPLFVVLGRAWALLLEPTGLSVAMRINLFSAFMSAAAHGFWFLVFHHILRFFSEDRSFRLVGAGVAVLVSATAFTVWNQSNVNEKVYTVSLLTIALLTWLVFRWQERLGKGKDDNLLVLMVFVLALSVGNHLMAFLAAPAIGLFILMVNPKALFNWKLYPAAGVAVLLGLSIHLFLPIRAELDPVINEAAPECQSIGGALASVATYGNAGCAPLNEALQRDQYQKPPLNPRQAPLASQLLNYLQYFDWQWARSVDGENTLLSPFRLLFTMLFTGLGVWGAMEHYRNDRRSFWYMLTLFGTLSIGLVYYLNFKYGYSIPDPIGDLSLHEVRERDYFFIVSFSLWGLWAGLGIAAIWNSLSDRAGGLLKAAPILLVGLLPLALNASWADRSQDYAARDWAYNLLQSVEPYGVLFTNGDNDTFPLWYLQEVEGIRRDVTVIVTSYLNTAWYAKQIQGLTRPCPEGVDPSDDPTRIICQRPYEPDTNVVYTVNPDEVEEGTALLVDRPISLPTRGLLRELDDATIDEYSELVQLTEQTLQSNLGPVIATIRAGSYLQPWHRFALFVIRDAMGDRPVYFASSGNAPDALGLTPYLVRQGLAFKLYPGDPATDTTGRIIEQPPGSQLTRLTGTRVDYPRTRELADSVFIHRGALPEWSHWPDQATIGIPSYYSWVYWSLAQSGAILTQTDAAASYRQSAEAWYELGQAGN